MEGPWRGYRTTRSVVRMPASRWPGSEHQSLKVPAANEAESCARSPGCVRWSFQTFVPADPAQPQIVVVLAPVHELDDRRPALDLEAREREAELGRAHLQPRG